MPSYEATLCGSLRMPTLEDLRSILHGQNYVDAGEKSCFSKDFRRCVKKLTFGRGEHMSATGRAVFVDVETTGLDPMRDEIVELAIVGFTFDRDVGRIDTYGVEYCGMSEPRQPIPKAATAIHGISDAMVAGRSLDESKIRRAIGTCEVIVAHNAQFDRAFLVKRFPWMAQWRWLCSMRQIDWGRRGFARRGLGYLSKAHGLRFVQHRAQGDAMAGVMLLGWQGENGQYYLEELLQALS